MQIMAKLTIAADIPYHQIIARKDPRVPFQSSSDGLVPYWSSYLAGAESTLVVESGHHVQDNRVGDSRDSPHFCCCMSPLTRRQGMRRH
jgi:hypothetical protein